jgi:hypothetical protein
MTSGQLPTSNDRFQPDLANVDIEGAGEPLLRHATLERLGNHVVLLNGHEPVNPLVVGKGPCQDNLMARERGASRLTG